MLLFMPLLHPAAKHPIARVARNTGRATFELFFHNNNSLYDAMDEEQRRQSDENPAHNYHAFIQRKLCNYLLKSLSPSTPPKL